MATPQVTGAGEEGERKPRVLVLGAAGAIGRMLVSYLVQEGLVSRVKAADKAIPEMAYFSETQLAIFRSDAVEFVQADLTKEAHLNMAFAPFEDEAGGEGKEGDQAQPSDAPLFDYVINLAAETRYGQPKALYEDRCTKLSAMCAAKAKEVGVRRFVEVSTAMVYKPQSRRPATESSPLEPWTGQAEASLAAERNVQAVEGLDHVIVRPAFVYGPGDVNGIMPRVVCAAAYVRLNETMKFLWDGSMRINTVHVRDVVRAVWHCASSPDVPSGAIYNLVDKNDTDQGKMNALLANLFNIRTGFVGRMLSNVARLAMETAVEAANEKHLAPWTDLCAEYNINNSPLSPYLSQELLEHNHLHVSGNAIETTGFSYDHPTMTEDLIREAVDTAVGMGYFPPVLGTGEQGAGQEPSSASDDGKPAAEEGGNEQKSGTS